MVIHFETLQKALDHLSENGFHIIKGGRFISKDGLVLADIATTRTDVVAIYFYEKE